jgi:hypothetical protein
MRTAALCGFLLGIGLTAVPALSAERWTMQFFHDEDESALSIGAIAFPTPTRGLAVGALIKDDNEKGVTLVTTDGGANWTTLPAPDIAHSLFCLDEAACWMVGRNGVWLTTEAGRDWRRVFRQRGITRVYFTSRDRGWAIGAEKKLFETRDGGKRWNPMPVRSEVKTNPERTVFHAISFAGKAGLITGRSEPPERSNLPLWMDDKVQSRRERPALSVVLMTEDGGENWAITTSSLFGRVAVVRTNVDGRGLALVEFDRWFAYPSELFRMDLRGGSNDRSLRESDFVITDVALVPSGSGFAVGYEPPGKLARAPIPGKLKVMQSNDLKAWTDMDVDYRAVARRVVIAAHDQANVWLATDTGMILKLARD